MIEAILIVWVIVLLWEMGFITTQNRPTVGLLAMCIAIFSLSHWFGALVHLFPWASLPASDEWTERGFVMTSIGVLSLWIGATFVAPIFSRRLIGTHGTKPTGGVEMFANRYIAAGFVLVGLVSPFLGGVPSVASLGSSGIYLVLTGVCLYAWKYADAKDDRKLALLLGSLFLLPLITLALTENVVRAVAAILLVFIFTARIYRPRWRSAMAMAVLVYVGLSFGVTYLSQRVELREMLREEQVAGKFLRSIELVREFEFLNPANEDQLVLIDLRMNQNWLVGAAIENYTEAGAEHLHGETIYLAIAALVPRIIWPEKTITAGGMDFATTMTGIGFAEGTSVGMGPILELYGNFGFIGVFAGMFLLGILIGALDRGAYWALAERQYQTFALYFVVGLSLLRAEGSFVEGSVIFAANWIVAWTVNKLILRASRNLVLDDRRPASGSQSVF